MSIMDLAYLIAAMEEAEREEKEAQRFEPAKPTRYTTKIINETGWPGGKVIESNRPGRLKELSIRNSTNNFTLTVNIDGSKLRMTYTQMEQESPYISWLDAFENNGTYIAVVKNLEWVNKAKISVSKVDRLFGAYYEEK